ncbi:MAG: cob(I)yrinic acid a,c-diamide adenosyltransferase [Negativicutes bacterium]|nr:cob(I)yrinic acid a,c-diamide adenosyltransferase [Negativicutes bacterium]
MNANTAKVLIFTGEGKGKTTAALGLAVAAAAQGRKAVMVQFLKGGGYTGELFAQQQLAPGLVIRQFGYGCPIATDIKSGAKQCIKCGECFRENRNPVHDYAGQALAFANEVLLTGKTDLVVLDEISHAIRHRLLAVEQVIELIANRPSQVDLVLTGRNMPAALLALADRVTECRVVKHPLQAGIDARRGSEY